MAGELVLPNRARTGQTLYAQVWNAIGQVWDTTGSPAFGAYATANIANYTIALTEKGTASGVFVGNMPACVAGVYGIVCYQKVGGSVAETDPDAGGGNLYWDGSAVNYLAVLPRVTLVDTVTTTTTATNVTTVNGLAANVVTAAAIADGAIDAGAIAADAITAAKIADGAIDTATFASGTTIPRCTLTDVVTVVNGLAGGVITAASIASDAITAAKVADGAIDAATFAAGAINAAAIASDAITAAKIADGAIDGATFASGALDAVWSTAARLLTAGTNIVLAKGVGVTGFNDPTVAAIADGVWDETLADHLGVGSTGAALNAAGSLGDPWATALPGAYGAGTAGKIVGDNINASVSSRLASASISLSGGAVTVGTNNDKTGYSLAVAPPTAAAIVTAVWTDLLASSDFSTVASIGKLLKDDIDAAISSRGTGTALDAAGVRSAVGLASANLDTQLAALPTTTTIWAAGTRTLTAGTNIVLAKGVGVTGFNDLDAAGVRTAVGLTSANLDAQLGTLATASALTTVGGNVTTILGQTGTTGVVVASGSKTGYSLAAAGLDLVVVETGLNARQALSIIASSAAGVLAGAATTTVTIAAAGVPATNRITGTVTADGNRTAVTLSPPA